MTPLVAACGLTTLDLVQYVDRLPGPNEKVQAHDARIEFGGPAANAAFTARVLGLRSRLLTCIGRSALMHRGRWWPSTSSARQSARLPGGSVVAGRAAAFSEITARSAPVTATAETGGCQSR